MARQGAHLLLSDNETKLDLLNNRAIAATLVGLLRERPERPVIAGVHGDWGAGKSSVLEMIEDTLKGQPEVLCLRFNGWRFQGFENAKIALLESILAGLVERRSAKTKVVTLAKELFKRIDWLKLARYAGGLWFSFKTGLPLPEQLQAAVSFANTVRADPAQFDDADKVKAALDGVVSLLSAEGGTKNVPEEIAAFRRAFDELLAQADIKQLIVLIDDLDRCLPDTAIETLEAIRLFVLTARTAFVVAADEAMVEFAVRKHFPELPDTTGPRDYARNYLEKLIQVPFRIPPLGEAETRTYVTLLLVGEALQDDAAFLPLVAAASKKLNKPWEATAIDATAVKESLGTEKFAKVNELVTMSERIGPVLARGTHGNPRQIKRFLNSLLLRQGIAKARGFDAAVNISVLAKLMLAERFQASLFECIAQVAAADPLGRSTLLRALESRAGHREPLKVVSSSAEHGERSVTPKVDGTGGAETVDLSASEAAILEQWLESKDVVAWAIMPPALVDVDLRPYLFIAKDRKNYLGAISALGRLVATVERLLGTKMAVRAMEEELRKLVPDEAVQVFNAVAERVLGASDFAREPQGVAGLTVLVRAQPAMQERLLDLVDRLPTDQLGVWAAAGWSEVITAPDSQRRLEGIFARWAQTAKSPALRSAAAVRPKFARLVS